MTIDETTQRRAALKGRNIGFLGGGNMAAALIRGLLQSESVGPAQIRASDVKPERLVELGQKYEIETTEDNEAWCDGRTWSSSR